MRKQSILAFFVVIQCITANLKANIIEFDKAKDLATQAVAKSLDKSDFEINQFALKRTLLKQSAILSDADINYFPYVFIFESKTTPAQIIEVYMRKDGSYDLARWIDKQPAAVNLTVKPQFKFSDLIGTWTATTEEFENIITFNSDQTYKGKILHKGKLRDEYTGIWNLFGDKIQYCYEASKLMEEGQRDTDWILDLKTDRFIIRTISGETREYWKVK